VTERTEDLRARAPAKRYGAWLQRVGEAKTEHAALLELEADGSLAAREEQCGELGKLRLVADEREFGISSRAYCVR